MSPIAPNQTNPDKNQGSRSPSQESSKPANPGIPETANQNQRSESDLNQVKDVDAENNRNKTGADADQKHAPAANPESKDPRNAPDNTSKAS